MKGYYELKTTDAGKFHFTLNAGNHEVILSSQLYAERDDAHSGIESTRANGPLAARYERKLSAIGEPYFSLKAANGQVIGSSEMYGSEASRDLGIRSVVANCPSTTVKDLTGTPPG
ncbi:YegP family protein [bacterium]|nr:YegP family protein [bacterium]